MNNFISNLISRHIAPANNVMPRLRGKFEAESNLSNTLPGDISSSVENFTEPTAAAATLPPPPPISQKHTGVEKKEQTFSFESEPDFLNQNTDHPEIINDHPVKPLNIAVEEFTKEPVQNKTLKNDEVADPVPGKKNDQKENHLVITNYHKTANEEWVIKQENKKEKDVLFPVEPKPIDPFIGNNEFAISSHKQGGLLGEPPAFNHAKGNQHFVINDSAEDHSTPIIKVTIGQINVRAVTSPQVTAKKQQMVPKPTLSLEDYLKQRRKR